MYIGCPKKIASQRNDMLGRFRYLFSCTMILVTPIQDTRANLGTIGTVYMSLECALQPLQVLQIKSTSIGYGNRFQELQCALQETEKGSCSTQTCPGILYKCTKYHGQSKGLSKLTFCCDAFFCDTLQYHTKYCTSQID